MLLLAGLLLGPLYLPLNTQLTTAASCAHAHKYADSVRETQTSKCQPPYLGFHALALKLMGMSLISKS